MVELFNASAQQQYVFRASGGAVTTPVGGSWLSAYALYLGATSIKGTWLQTICEELGITEPLNGSWVQALAAHYGIFEPINGNWWIALAIGDVEPGGEWILETGIWNADGIWTADGIWKDGAEWILEQGYWNADGIWIDTGIWKTVEI